MKKSYKVGIALALGLTMSSSFMVQHEDTATGWPFGLPIIAQASAGGSAGNLDILHERTVALRESTLIKRQRQALVSRDRELLQSEARVSVATLH